MECSVSMTMTYDERTIVPSPACNFPLLDFVVNVGISKVHGWLALTVIAFCVVAVRVASSNTCVEQTATILAQY